MPEGDAIHHAANRIRPVLEGGRIRARCQDENNRTTYWCPGCQR